jgi:hypothetical protein
MALNLKHTTILAAMTLAAVAATSSHARAFSMESQGGGNSGASANFGDPDDKVMQNFGLGGSSSGQSGSTLQYGTPMPNNGQGGVSLQFGTPITTTTGQGNPAQAPSR